MYIVSRFVQEQLVFEDGTVITLVKSGRGKATLGIELPSGKKIYRGEKCPIPFKTIAGNHDSNKHKAGSKSIPRR